MHDPFYVGTAIEARTQPPSTRGQEVRAENRTRQSIGDCVDQYLKFCFTLNHPPSGAEAEDYLEFNLQPSTKR